MNTDNTAPTLNGERGRAEDAFLASAIGRLLRLSILVSGSVIAFGLIVWAFRNDAATSVDQVLGEDETSIAVSPSSIARGVGDLSSIAIIQLGLLVLLVTPTLRVLITATLFVRQRSWYLVVSSAIVLVILVLGLLGVIEG